METLPAREGLPEADLGLVQELLDVVPRLKPLALLADHLLEELADHLVDGRMPPHRHRVRLLQQLLLDAESQRLPIHGSLRKRQGTIAWNGGGSASLLPRGWQVCLRLKASEAPPLGVWAKHPEAVVDRPSLGGDLPPQEPSPGLPG